MENQSSVSNSSQHQQSSSESSEFRTRPELKTITTTSQYQSYNHKCSETKDDPYNTNNYAIVEETANPNSFTQLKRELSKYKKIAEERQLEILNEQMKAREANSKLDAALSLNKKYEEEIKSYRDKSSSSLFSKTSSDDEASNAFSIFENVLNTDAEKMSALSEQRNDLVKICGTYQQYLDVSDKEIQDLQGQLKNEKLNSNFDELLEEILKIVPSDHQEGNDQPSRERILSIVQSLVEQSYSSSYSKEEKKSNDPEILGHLENALYFIRTLKVAPPDSKEPEKDKKLRKMIDDQCDEIESFLKEHKPEKVASLFENSSMEDQLKAFNKFIDENDHDESPIRELYSLFTAAVEVNKMLFERNSELNEEFQNVRNQTQEMQEAFDEQNAENEQKDKIIEELLDKMETTLEQRPENVITGYDDVYSIISELMNEMSKRDKEVTKMKSTCDKLKKSDESKTAQIRAKEKQIVDLVKRYNETQYKSETQNAELASKLADAQSQIKFQQSDREALAKANHDLEKLHKKVTSVEELRAQLHECQDQNMALQADVARLTQQMDTYQQSEDLNVSTLSGYENRVSAMKGKMGYLKKRNAELESQLHGTFEDMKSRHEALEETYQNTIKQLKDENDELRSKLNEEKEAIKQVKNMQKNYQAKIAKMKLDEVQRVTELNDVKNSLKMSEQRTNAKLDAQRIAYETQLEQSKIHCVESAKKLALIIGEKSNENEDLDDAIKKVEEKHDAKFVNEAYKTANYLKLKKNESLFNAVTKIIEVIEQKEEENQKLEENRKVLEKNLDEANQVASSMTAEELSVWKKWANKLYRRLNGGEMNPINPEKTRKSIEKAVDKLTKPEIIERKFDILKKQKSILQETDKKTIKEKGKKPIDSIRSITLSFMFVGRLQKFAQTVQLPYKLAAKRQ